MEILLRLLRIAKQHILRPNVNKKPVIILASRRGGSTLVSNIISSQRGVWLANEPFAVFPSHPAYELKKQILPHKEHSQFFDLSDSELQKFQSYVSGLLNIKYRSLGTCAKTKFPLISDRVCLKILNTPWMLEWFIENIDAHLVFFTRHPGGQAVSVIRQGWDFPVKAYFNTPSTLTKIFSDKQISLGFDVLKRNNIWEVAILDWIVCTYHGRTSQNSKLIKTTYEDIIVKPESFINEIMVSKFGFLEIQEMYEVLKVPSMSSKMCTKSTIDAIQNNNKYSLLTLWRKNIDDEKLRIAQNLLEAFNVYTYSMYEDMPLK